jgi:uncharacterized protein YcfL
MHMRFPAVIIPLTLLLLAGCRSDRRPASILAHDKFVEVYADLLQTSSRARDAQVDTLQAAQDAAAVLRKHGVTPEQMRATLEWYNADVQRWKTVFEDVTRAIERIQTQEAG